jgi:hypothetical protein
MNLFALVFHGNPALWLPGLLYIGPDVFMPLLSALAAILGALLLFWQKVMALAGRLWRLVTKR